MAVLSSLESEDKEDLVCGAGRLHQEFLIAGWQMCPQSRRVRLNSLALPRGCGVL